MIVMMKDRVERKVYSASNPDQLQSDAMETCHLRGKIVTLTKRMSYVKHKARFYILMQLIYLYDRICGVYCLA